MDHLGAAIGRCWPLAFSGCGRAAGHERVQHRGTDALPVDAPARFGGAGAAGVRIAQSPAGKPGADKLHLTLKPFDRNFKLLLLTLVVFTLGNSSDFFLLVQAGKLGVPTVLCRCSGRFPRGQEFEQPAFRPDRRPPRPPPVPLPGLVGVRGGLPRFRFRQRNLARLALFLSYALFYGLTEPAEKTLVANLAGRERKGLAYGWDNSPSASPPGRPTWSSRAVPVRGDSRRLRFGAVLALAAVVLLVGVKNRQPQVGYAR